MQPPAGHRRHVPEPGARPGKGLAGECREKGKLALSSWNTRSSPGDFIGIVRILLPWHQAYRLGLLPGDPGASPIGFRVGGRTPACGYQGQLRNLRFPPSRRAWGFPRAGDGSYVGGSLSRIPDPRDNLVPKPTRRS